MLSHLGGKTVTHPENFLSVPLTFQPVLSLAQQHLVHHSTEAGFWDHVAFQFCMEDNVFTGAGPHYYQTKKYLNL